MEFFIKKIFDGKAKGDELVHVQFQKFSRGNFTDRALVKAKNSKGKYSIGTTAEYGNEFTRCVAEKLGDEKTKVTGVVVSTRDLTGELDFKDKKQFQGVKRYIIETEMSGKEIIDLCDKLPHSFVGLSFNAGDTVLKIKPKAPKSGKPSSKGEEAPNPDFCKVKTADKEIVKNLLFDVEVENFKEALVTHVFSVEDIDVDYSIKDPKEMREKAVRKGKIIRKTIVDGSEKTSEKAFEA